MFGFAKKSLSIGQISELKKIYKVSSLARHNASMFKLSDNSWNNSKYGTLVPDDKDKKDDVYVKLYEVWSGLEEDKRQILEEIYPRNLDSTIDSLRERDKYLKLHEDYIHNFQSEVVINGSSTKVNNISLIHFPYRSILHNDKEDVFLMVEGCKDKQRVRRRYWQGFTDAKITGNFIGLPDEFYKDEGRFVVAPFAISDDDANIDNYKDKKLKYQINQAWILYKAFELQEKGKNINFSSVKGGKTTSILFGKVAEYVESKSSSSIQDDVDNMDGVSNRRDAIKELLEGFEGKFQEGKSGQDICKEYLEDLIKEDLQKNSVCKAIKGVAQNSFNEVVLSQLKPKSAKEESASRKTPKPDSGNAQPPEGNIIMPFDISAKGNNIDSDEDEKLKYQINQAWILYKAFELQEKGRNINFSSVKGGKTTSILFGKVEQCVNNKDFSSIQDNISSELDGSNWFRGLANWFKKGNSNMDSGVVGRSDSVKELLAGYAIRFKEGKSGKDICKEHLKSLIQKDLAKEQDSACKAITDESKEDFKSLIDEVSQPSEASNEIFLITEGCKDKQGEIRNRGLFKKSTPIEVKGNFLTLPKQFYEDEDKFIVAPFAISDDLDIDDSDEDKLKYQINQAWLLYKAFEARNQNKTINFSSVRGGSNLEEKFLHLSSAQDSWPTNQMPNKDAADSELYSKIRNELSAELINSTDDQKINALHKVLSDLIEQDLSREDEGKTPHCSNIEEFAQSSFTNQIKKVRELKNAMNSEPLPPLSSPPPLGHEGAHPPADDSVNEVSPDEVDLEGTGFQSLRTGNNRPPEPQDQRQIYQIRQEVVKDKNGARDFVKYCPISGSEESKNVKSGQYNFSIKHGDDKGQSALKHLLNTHDGYKVDDGLVNLIKDSAREVGLIDKDGEYIENGQFLICAFMILAAKHHGVGNKKEEFKSDLRKILADNQGKVEEKNVDDCYKIAKKFSNKFQENAERWGAMTGNENAKSFVGMRLSRVSNPKIIQNLVVDYNEQLEYKDKIDIDSFLTKIGANGSDLGFVIKPSTSPYVDASGVASFSLEEAAAAGVGSLENRVGA